MLIQQNLQNSNKEKRKNHIAKLWIAGSCSATVIIPKILANKYNLTEPCHVIFEPKSDGILLRKIPDN